MEEVFIEHIVKRKTTMSAICIRFGCIFAILVCFLLFQFLGVLALTLVALMIYGTYLAWVYTSIEYEYSFLNGELSVDRIQGQRKRKKMAEFKIKDAEIVADADSEEILRRVRREMKVYDYSSGARGTKKYAIILNEAKGASEVIFEPNDKMIEAIHHARPSIVHISE